MYDLSESEEEYLEALYRLGGGKGQIKVGELARELDVKEPSVVEMLGKLKDKGLVDYEKYSGAGLTEEGEEVGRRVTRRHRLAERLLSDVLDRDLSQVHEEACRLEHSLADETADEIAKVLEDPETCPHGHPIPEGEGALEQEDVMRLTEGSEGHRYEVVSIPEDKEDVRRLLPLAVLPGSKIELTEKTPFSALMIRKGRDKLALSQNLASKIMVRPYGERRRRRRRGRTGG